MCNSCNKVLKKLEAEKKRNLDVEQKMKFRHVHHDRDVGRRRRSRRGCDIWLMPKGDGGGADAR